MGIIITVMAIILMQLVIHYSLLPYSGPGRMINIIYIMMMMNQGYSIKIRLIITITIIWLTITIIWLTIIIITM